MYIGGLSFCPATISYLTWPVPHLAFNTIGNAKSVSWRTVLFYALAVVSWGLFGFITGLHLVFLFFIEKFRINGNFVQNKIVDSPTIQKEGDTRDSQVPPM